MLTKELNFYSHFSLEYSKKQVSMKFKTLDDFDFRGKTVLLRSDINSELKNRKPVLSDRISESAKTIAELKKKGAKVVVLAHQGRPGKEDFISLEGHAKLLNEFTKIKFVKDVIGEKAVGEIRRLRDGEAILLENVRGLKEEFDTGKNKLVQTLSGACDIYLNDAFSVSHREQTSIVGFPRVMPSGIGRIMQAELDGLEKLSRVKDALYILGGSKEDNILLMQKKRVVTCGVFGQMCLIAKGYDLGAQNKFLEKEGKIEFIPELEKVVSNAGTPVDLAVCVNGRRKELLLSEFPSEYEVFDIGSETQKQYIEMIRDVSAIFMKGTAGYCEEEQFCSGTRALMKAIEKSKAFKIFSGGHTLTAVQKFGIDRKKIDYISLSGGALVWYLAGRKLPGLDVLLRNKH